MIAGDGFGGPISVRSATTIFHGTFLSAGNVRSEHAIGAGGIDNEDLKEVCKGSKHPVMRSMTRDSIDM